MRYAFFFATAMTIAACGGISIEPLRDGGLDATTDGSDLTCRVGGACSEIAGCPCTVIDECGCEPNSAKCQFYTCLSDADGTQCLNGHECAAGHCAVMAQPAGDSCGPGLKCDGDGGCSCLCDLSTAEPTGYFSDSGCSVQVLVLHATTDGGAIGVACGASGSWNVSGIIETQTLDALAITPQRWWFMHGGTCESQISTLAIKVVPGDSVAVGQPTPTGCR